MNKKNFLSFSSQRFYSVSKDFILLVKKNHVHEFFRQAFKMRQTEEQRKVEEMRRQKEEAMLQKRQEYVEKTKNVLVFGEMPNEKTGKKGKKGRTEQYVSDSGGSGNEEGRREEAPREKKRKRKASGEGKERKSRGRIRRKNDESGGNIKLQIFHFWPNLLAIFS